MPLPLSYHVVKTAYGRWLPGDSRGSWSESWSRDRGYFGAHQFHEANLDRETIARDRMRHTPVLFDDGMQQCIVRALAECVAQAKGSLRIISAALEPMHLHLLVAYTKQHEIRSTVQWIGHKTTRAIHDGTTHVGPVWVKNKWCCEIENLQQWDNAIDYIEAHNVRAGRGVRPYPFLWKEVE